MLVIDIDTDDGSFEGKLVTHDRGSTKLVWARWARDMEEGGECSHFGAIAGASETDPSRTGIAVYLPDIDDRFRVFPRTCRSGSRTRNMIHWAAVRAYCEDHECRAFDAKQYDIVIPARPRFRARPGLSQSLGQLMKIDSPPDDNIFRDRIVILGANYSDADRHSTPIGAGNGSDIIGQVVEAELTGDLLDEPNHWQKYALKLVIGLLILLFNRYLWPMAALVASITIMGMVMIPVTLGAFYLGAVLFDLMAFWIVIVIEQLVQSAEFAHHGALERHGTGEGHQT